MSASLALQKAVFARLDGDAALTALIGSHRVYDGAPRNAAAPYVHLGEVEARDWSTATETGDEIEFAIVVWSRVPGRAEGFAIAARVVALLHDAAMTLTGYRLVNLRHAGTETARGERADARRVVARFRAVTEPL